MSETKKFVDLDGLKYFLEKLKYELAHNGPSKTDENDDNEESASDK